jgi:phosphoribosyl-AMP cyclohydrolase
MTFTFADPRPLSHASLEEGDIFAPRFDAHGLITAITIEASTGVVLMVAHMNAEALSLTLETGDVHYFSRSRGKLWKKGETSGEVQKLVEIRVDCDQDALLVTVEQTGRGAACHTGRKTCFYRKVAVEKGEARLAETGEKRLFDPEVVYNR